VRDAVATPAFFNRRNRIAAADNRRAFRARDGLRDRDGAVRERVDLEYAHRPVPDDRPRVVERLRVRPGRARPMSSPSRSPIFGFVHAQRLGRRALLDLRRDDVIDREEQREPARFRALEDVARGVLLVASTSDLPTGLPCALRNVYAIAPPISRRSTRGISSR